MQSEAAQNWIQIGQDALSALDRKCPFLLLMAWLPWVPPTAAAANLLKPMLGRGELRCIGATTLTEYRKYIEKDPALERRFQQVRADCNIASLHKCTCHHGTLS